MPEKIKLAYFKSLKFLVGKQDWNHLLMFRSMFIFLYTAIQKVIILSLKEFCHQSLINFSWDTFKNNNKIKN